MGGRCGGPSLRERALNQQIHAKKLAAQNQLKPPYSCPKCCSSKALGAKEEKIGREKIFTFKCCRCGFTSSVVLNGNIFTSLDAYNKLLDLVVQKVT